MNDCVIAISHSNYRIKSAGVEKYITDVTALLEHCGIQSVQVFPIIEVNRRTVRLGREYVGINVNGAYEGVFLERELYHALLALQQKYHLHYVGVHLHHLHGWDLPLLEQTLKMLDLPIKLMIHDYEMICDAMLKSDGNGPVCRKKVVAPDAIRCGKCKYAKESISRFEEMDGFLNQIDPLVERVIAPSEIAGNVWTGIFGRLAPKLAIREHLVVSGSWMSPKETDSKIRIAYIGSTAPHKGFLEWQELIRILPKTEYELYYFGNSIQEQKNVCKVHVDFHDQNAFGMTEQLKANGIDVVFLWSTWLETYCYTAYEACSAGCFLLTVSDSGNIAAMVRKNGCGRIFDSLEQCGNYLTSVSTVRTELKKYRETHQIPIFASNGSFEELGFLRQRDNDCIKKQDGLKQLREGRSFLFSRLYAAARGNYNK